MNIGDKRPHDGKLDAESCYRAGDTKSEVIWSLQQLTSTRKLDESGFLILG